jgi:hypothetical protein
MKRAGKIVLLISAITGFCICTHASGKGPQRIGLPKRSGMERIFQLITHTAKIKVIQHGKESSMVWRRWI